MCGFKEMILSLSQSFLVSKHWNHLKVLKNKRKCYMSCNFQFVSFSLHIYFMNHVVHVVFTCLAKPFVQYF